MALHGVSSGELDIESPVDTFFRSITEDIIQEEETDQVDWEKKSVTFGMNGCLIPERYKTVKVTITVTPKEDEAKGSHVAWTVEFEKIRHDIEDPHFIIDILVNYMKEIDENLLI